MFQGNTRLSSNFGFNSNLQRNLYSGSPSAHPSLYVSMERREEHVSGRANMHVIDDGDVILD